MTGEPRPPQAPVEGGWTQGDRASDLGPATPPPGKGPALEWFADSKNSLRTTAAIALVFFLVFLTWRDGGFGWMKVWWLWLLLLAYSSLFLFGRKATHFTAGADWLRVGEGIWIDTYRLRSIRVTDAINTRHLVLDDTGDNQIHTQVWYLQKNRELWDLVYNGILHSIVHNGAEVNRRAVDHLHLQGVIRKPPTRR